ncbi:hypothetical protein [Paenibacillus glucanolyticus]|uniref:hypothetical protein n=1 Tax=Paenibacillus glucanolyticus TaxID=59843 RepID=UPI001D15C04C|nr:hypothetical protein [Paenibacillus glucanolyticus]
MMEIANNMARNEPRVDGTWEIAVLMWKTGWQRGIEQARTEYHDQTERGCGLYV